MSTSVHQAVGAGADPTFLSLSKILYNIFLRDMWHGCAADEEMSPQPPQEQQETLSIKLMLQYSFFEFLSIH